MTGDIPFADISLTVTVALKVLSGQRPPEPAEEEYPPGVIPSKLWKLITTCWSQDPKDRPTAADVVAEAYRLPFDFSSELGASVSTRLW